MNKKLNRILLIDDHAPTNSLNKRIIEASDCCHEVVTIRTAEDGLNYIKSGPDTNFVDLIFLDINMPAMNGWEFMEEYIKLDNSIKEKIIVMMLTTSLNPDDQRRANQTEGVNGLLTKPLLKDQIEQVLEAYFQWSFDSVA